MIHAPPGGELENTIIIMKKENAMQIFYDEHSFQIGYSSAMQTFAEAAAALEAGAHVQQ